MIRYLGRMPIFQRVSEPTEAHDDCLMEDVQGQHRLVAVSEHHVIHIQILHSQV